MSLASASNYRFPFSFASRTLPCISIRSLSPFSAIRFRPTVSGLLISKSPTFSSEFVKSLTLIGKLSLTLRPNWRVADVVPADRATAAGRNAGQVHWLLHMLHTVVTEMGLTHTLPYYDCLGSLTAAIFMWQRTEVSFMRPITPDPRPVHELSSIFPHHCFA